MDDLDRIFLRLVENLRASYPEYLSRPFEVSELYQTLVPYRHNRRELAIETNGDYELALIRLIGGERGYMLGEGNMQELIRRELSGSNPNTAIFRDFAATRVALAPDAAAKADQLARGTGRDDPPPPNAFPEPPAPARAPVPAAPVSVAPTTTAPVILAPAPAADYAPAAPRAPEGQSATYIPIERIRAEAPMESNFGSGSARDPREAREGRDPADTPEAREGRDASSARDAREGRDGREPRETRDTAMSAAAARGGGAGGGAPGLGGASSRSAGSSTSAGVMGGNCRYCNSGLPTSRRVVFCPHCGQNLTIQRCPACGTELEIGWKFCITCGRGVSDS
ncbi:MAG: zinc ribbon domain-containing protein [Gemmatimonadaceae bacterium]